MHFVRNELSFFIKYCDFPREWGERSGHRIVTLCVHCLSSEGNVSNGGELSRINILFVFVIRILMYGYAEKGVAQSVSWLCNGLQTKGVCFDSRRGKRFSLLQSGLTGSGHTQLPLQREHQTLSPERKQHGREVDHSPTSRACVQNEWSYSLISPYVFVTCIGTKL